MARRNRTGALVALAVCGIQLLYSTTAHGQQETSLAPKVTILGKTLSLKESKGGNPGQPFIAEYIPSNETWDNWTTMYATRFVPGRNLDPKQSAQATAKNVLEKRNAGDPIANAAIFEAKDGKSVAVDFLVSSDKPEMFEHNVFRYFKTPNGLVSIQIARRIYGANSSEDQMQGFIKEIPKVRNEIFKEIARPDLPKFPKA